MCVWGGGCRWVIYADALFNRTCHETWCRATIGILIWFGFNNNNESAKRKIACNWTFQFTGSGGLIIHLVWYYFFFGYYKYVLLISCYICISSFGAVIVLRDSIVLVIVFGWILLMLPPNIRLRRFCACALVFAKRFIVCLRGAYSESTCEPNFELNNVWMSPIELYLVLSAYRRRFLSFSFYQKFGFFGLFIFTKSDILLYQCTS